MPCDAPREVRDLRVVDERGVLRLSLQDATLTLTTVADVVLCVREAIERATHFGDVGRAIPALYVLRASRIAAFEGLTSAEQGSALAAEEMEGCAPGERIALAHRTARGLVHSRLPDGETFRLLERNRALITPI